MKPQRSALTRLFLLLAAMVLVLPAAAGAEDCGTSQHPSGNDRCVEAGSSGTQGDAQSDPDDDTRGPERTNGGVDEPEGPGGLNQQDQDGNNGCGNDQDFEDDNEGLCDGEPEPVTPEGPTTDTEVKDKDDGKIQPNKGDRGERPDPGIVPTGVTTVRDSDPITPPRDEARIGAPVAAARANPGPIRELPATGARETAALGLVSLLMLSLGVALLRRARAAG